MFDDFDDEMLDLMTDETYRRIPEWEDDWEDECLTAAERNPSMLR